jgi:ubiquinone/menaquinone biosynthesis C-methylase UbiE
MRATTHHSIIVRPEITPSSSRWPLRRFFCTPTSLDRLVRRADGASIVLDVGCGSGVLLQRLHVTQSRARTIGLDFSLPALHAASVRTPASNLIHARAQSIPLANASVDCVVSHMALMLMNDVDQVFGEIRRILRPEGTFCAVVQRSAPLHAVARQIFERLRPAWENLDPVQAAPSFGDTRTMDATSLQSLASEHFPACSVESFDLEQDIPRSNLAGFLVERFYGLDLISDELNGLIRGLSLPSQVYWRTPMLEISA